MFEEMQQKIEVPERVDKPAHQTDRFSYVEGDCSDAARELLKRCCCQAPSVKVGNGILSVTLVEKVEGEASMFQVRGQMRHTWDLSVKLRWTYQWMGSNFDAGAQRAEGHLAVVDFTDATTLTGEKSPPLLRKNWLDKGTLELPRQKEVEKALGGKPWPPEKGTLLASVVAALEARDTPTRRSDVATLVRHRSMGRSRIESSSASNARKGCTASYRMKGRHAELGHEFLTVPSRSQPSFARGPGLNTSKHSVRLMFNA
ncbi:unnamed protein product [Durusdinium trenchii]|uniref:Activator of Hsp90 ATPase AHSA1-like N-terminal domain-containing protein n=1 Tax=Durusdinium trenchii TaxID=1381693 RepID=A0ABP0M5B5_9DINO